MKKLLSLLILIFAAGSLYARPLLPIPAADSLAATKPPRLAADSDSTDTRFSVQLSYGSDNVSQGERASQAIPYSGLLFEYRSPKGFHTGFSADYLYNDGKVDEGYLDFGYKLVDNKKSDLDLTWTKFFYASGSPLALAGTASNFNLYYGHDFNVLYSELNLNADLLNRTVRKLSSRSADFNISWALSHDFEKENFLHTDDLLEIIPTVTVTAGSQYYYQAYYNRLKIRRDRMHMPTPPSQFDPSFKKTSYMLGLPIDYSIGIFRFEVCESYFIPLNQPANLRSGNSWLFYAMAEVDF